MDASHATETNVQSHSCPAPSTASIFAVVVSKFRQRLHKVKSFRHTISEHVDQGRKVRRLPYRLDRIQIACSQGACDQNWRGTSAQQGK